MKFSEILPAARHTFQVNSINDLIVLDIGEDWVVTSKSSKNRAGGARMIVPKSGTNYFVVPSSYIADQQNGVSAYYSIIFRSFSGSIINLSKEIGTFLGTSPIEIMKSLKCEETSIGTFFINSPKGFIRKLSRFTPQMELVRPNNEGEYHSSL